MDFAADEQARQARTPRIIGQKALGANEIYISNQM